ncbi:glycogen-debranching protein [Synechococcus sp. UW140]|uniref:glycogen debranching protein n=1 Tax=Synechococcus sp. UW140 TaxID=368503 RepID=UPI000E0F76AF|nr:isoamylase [Synechococcus sp. UW140]
MGSSITPMGVNFSLAAPTANRVELLLFSHADAVQAEQIIELDSNHRSGDYWHVEVEGLTAGCCYGYRVFGPLQPGGHGFLPAKVLLDPCARAIAGWNVYRRGAATGASPNTDACLKAVVCERDRFDFDAHPRPRHSWTSSVIYELHVGSFTRRDDSGVEPSQRGTLRGLITKLPYLSDLGVTAIELLPIQAFDLQDAPPGRDNVWGYSPLSWFAPHQGFIEGDDPLSARHQVRELVAACHDAGIEVLLDVVYNHTTEGNQQGPTLSWRGIADKLYYHQSAKGDYQDVSGCGNSIAANRPLVRELILESMRCWAIELGIDGFRFDLGIALSRGENLKPLDRPPLFEAIDADPHLSDLKLVSEPWDCGGLYRLSDFPAKRIGAWNGRFRDDLRSFWKGDENSTWKLGQRLRGSPDLNDGKPLKLDRSVNFITAHDGFTLADLVCFNRKHNLANGEDNRDGENHNSSWNHGVEGPCTDLAVQALRRRQQRNLLTSLLLSRGVPMLLMGDEVGRSQGGNNNTWCQDSPLSWMTWRQDQCDQDLFCFLQRLLHARRELTDLLNSGTAISEIAPKCGDDPDRLWRQWHGVELQKPDWASWSHCLATSLHQGERGAVLWVGFNSYFKAMHFDLPPAASAWHRLIDTALPPGQDLPERAEPWSPNSVPLESRSMVVMVAKEWLPN